MAPERTWTHKRSITPIMMALLHHYGGDMVDLRSAGMKAGKEEMLTCLYVDIRNNLYPQTFKVNVKKHYWSFFKERKTVR